MIEKCFKLKEHGTNVKTEVMAGMTSFMTMAYILAVNPSILSVSGMDPNAVLIATSLACFVGTMLMALLSNYPFILAPGMGLNAYMAYTVVLKMGYSWQVALLAVFIEGIIFVIMSITNIREALFNAIPMCLKISISAGIGLFIAFIGMQNANLSIGNASTLVTYQTFKGEYFNSVGMGAIIALVGVLLTGWLLAKKIQGGILLGIFGTWIIAILCEITGLYVPNPEVEMYSTIPSGIVSFDFSSFGNTFGQIFQADLTGISIINFVTVIFAFLFVDLFDTLATLVGVAAKADMLDENGSLPKIKGALLADSLATTTGAVFGTTTTTTCIESASGILNGGRTGLTGVTAAVLFLVAAIFSPIFIAVPSFATAPALIIVGFYMLSSILKIDFDNMLEAIPAYLSVIAMPFTYSIAEGMAIGVISYTVLNLLAGKEGRKKVSLVMLIMTIIFILKYIVL